MSFKKVELELSLLATESGVIACALVAMDSGIIYCTTSTVKQFQMIAEGARDYWSLHSRNGKIFEIMGELSNVHVRHKKGIISLQECGTNTLLITLVKNNQVNWKDWPEATKKLKVTVDSYYANLIGGVQK